LSMVFLIASFTSEDSKIEDTGLDGELKASESKVNRLREQLDQPVFSEPWSSWVSKTVFAEYRALQGTIKFSSCMVVAHDSSLTYHSK